MSDNPSDFIDPDKCPKCQGPLFDAVDSGDGSHYITCHTPGCKRIEYKEPEELRPCPFCGRAPRTMDRADNHSKTGHIWVISCTCDGFSARAHQLRDTKEAVVEAWNKRS